MIYSMGVIRFLYISDNGIYRKYIAVVPGRAIQLSDANSGFPEEGIAYAQVPTSGYKPTFDLAGISYAVHTNSDLSHMVVCGDGQ